MGTNHHLRPAAGHEELVASERWVRFRPGACSRGTSPPHLELASASSDAGGGVFDVVHDAGVLRFIWTMRSPGITAGDRRAGDEQA